MSAFRPLGHGPSGPGRQRANRKPKTVWRVSQPTASRRQGRDIITPEPRLSRWRLAPASGGADLSAFRTSACAQSRGSGSAQSRATGISGFIAGPCAAAPGERSGRRSSVGDLLAKPPSCPMGNASTVVPRDHELGRAPLTRGVGLVHSSRISVHRSAARKGSPRRSR